MAQKPQLMLGTVPVTQGDATPSRMALLGDKTPEE